MLLASKRKHSSMWPMAESTFSLYEANIYTEQNVCYQNCFLRWQNGSSCALHRTTPPCFKSIHLIYGSLFSLFEIRSRQTCQRKKKKAVMM